MQCFRWASPMQFLSSARSRKASSIESGCTSGVSESIFVRTDGQFQAMRHSRSDNHGIWTFFESLPSWHLRIYQTGEQVACRCNNASITTANDHRPIARLGCLLLDRRIKASQSTCDGERKQIWMDPYIEGMTRRTCNYQS